MKRVWVLALCVLLWGCGGKKAELKVPAGTSSEPDRVLFNQALHDLQKSRYNVARLTLQTLINTYPDSEYLPQAKYAMAESFYKEGGSSNLNQAEVELKDFITFFPIDNKADDAQMLVIMTHIRQMQKPDRDSSQAKLAEIELNRMIENYPDSPLLDEAKTKLREVKEVLAEGEFKIGNLYLVRKSYPAAIGRYKTIIEKYPDYSATPDVLFNLGEALKASNNEPESGIYYSRIVIDHPYSERVALAKARLTELKIAIPETNPAATARGQQVKVSKSFFMKIFGGLGNRSPVSTETAAASVIDTTSSSSDKTDSEDSGVSGVSGSSGGSRGTGESTGGGSFNIDPAKVSPPPAKKKPR